MNEFSSPSFGVVSQKKKRYDTIAKKPKNCTKLTLFYAKYKYKLHGLSKKETYHQIIFKHNNGYELY